MCFEQNFEQLQQEILKQKSKHKNPCQNQKLNPGDLLHRSLMCNSLDLPESTKHNFNEVIFSCLTV